jgi:hypothetical protein
VAHIDARVHGDQVPTTYQPDDVVITGSELTQLSARDHAVLNAGQEVLELRGVEPRQSAPIFWRLGLG